MIFLLNSEEYSQYQEQGTIYQNKFIRTLGTTKQTKRN